MSTIVCLSIVIFFLLLSCFFLLRKIRKDSKHYYNNIHSLSVEYNKSQNQIKQLNGQIDISNQLNKGMFKLIMSKTPFKYVAQMRADVDAALFKEHEYELRTKLRPARTAAEKIRYISEQYKKKYSEYSQMLYKYNFLLSVFPELKYYLDDDETLLHISDFSSIEDAKESRDRVRDWINSEEYKSLSVDERNQLALDRYKARKKTNWEIGIEYELFIGYLLREGKAPFHHKYRVLQYGEINGLNDLGRDIIAERVDVNGNKTICLIQCKRWSERTLIHENSICQLFGTTMEYKIRHNGFSSCTFESIFITTTDLSEMAKEFASQLGVTVLKIPMGEYPMIKCNINNGGKIYHLPFDQQYHNTQIKNDGEFYAMTVKEAVDKGFRRAMKHFM